jgi:D-alanyl-D-alanine dipeptidase
VSRSGAAAIRSDAGPHCGAKWSGRPEADGLPPVAWSTPRPAPMHAQANEMRVLLVLAIAIAIQAESARGEQVPLPSGFVRLRDFAPTIRQDMRYAGPFNFTGAPVPGYHAPHCILWRPVAEALARAQVRLSAEGFHLKVYDCYRPARAVRAFAAWSKSAGRDTMRPVYYPTLDKSNLFALGFISLHSRHSLGIAVDVGLVAAGDPDLPAPSEAGACDGPFKGRAKESSVDLGTAFDCFSSLSTTLHPGVSREARANRERLVRALAAEGFSNYSREWWHFEFRSRPSPPRPYDFVVQ